MVQTAEAPPPPKKKWCQKMRMEWISMFQGHRHCQIQLSYYLDVGQLRQVWELKMKHGQQMARPGKTWTLVFLGQRKRVKIITVLCTQSGLHALQFFSEPRNTMLRTDDGFKDQTHGNVSYSKHKLLGKMLVGGLAAEEEWGEGEQVRNGEYTSGQAVQSPCLAHLERLPPHHHHPLPHCRPAQPACRLHTHPHCHRPHCSPLA